MIEAADKRGFKFCVIFHFRFAAPRFVVLFQRVEAFQRAHQFVQREGVARAGACGLGGDFSVVHFFYVLDLPKRHAPRIDQHLIGVGLVFP